MDNLFTHNNRKFQSLVLIKDYELVETKMKKFIYQNFNTNIGYRVGYDEFFRDIINYKIEDKIFKEDII
jgi:hypothetical protein